MAQKTKYLFDPNPLHILKKHTAAVLNVVFTINGSHCISTSQDKSLILWNPLKNLPIKEYTGPHNHQVVDVSIASSNAFFISVGGDKAAFHWDVTTGNVIRKFTGHNGKLNTCALTCNDTILWTGGYDKIVRLFDLRAQRKPLQTLSDATDAVSSFMELQDCQMLVTSVDGKARCYDIRKGLCTVDSFSSSLLKGCLTHDDRCYAINCLDECIRLVDMSTGKILNQFKGHKSSNYMLNAQFTPDDSYIVAPSEDGRIFIWDICANWAQTQTSPSSEDASVHSTQVGLRGASHVAIIETHTVTNGMNPYSRDCVFTVKFQPNEWRMITCHNDGTLKVWERPK